MDAILIESALFKLGFALAAIALAFGALRALDRANGINFGDVLEEIKSAPGTGYAIYFGLRILAVCNLVGWAIG